MTVGRAVGPHASLTPQSAVERGRFDGSRSVGERGASVARAACMAAPGRHRTLTQARAAPGAQSLVRSGDGT